MENQESGVSVGFVDELITDKYNGQLNFTVNKLGGIPDFPCNTKISIPKCPLCNLLRPLVVQIYAPLEMLPHHRTLYLFGCINPNCWRLSESWICLRLLSEEKSNNVANNVTKQSASEWCAEADDWNDCNEENGNVIDNLQSICRKETNCLVENLVQSKFECLNFFDGNENDSKETQGGAVGRLYSPVATAEIEGNEGEVISIDTPTIPQCNIMALMQEVNPVPPELFELASRKNFAPQFNPYFISVWQETLEDYSESISDAHVKELLQNYQQNNGGNCTNSGSGKESEAQGMNNFEKYEKSLPAHGDKMFHRFASKVRNNPGQILRYDRQSNPILPYPAPEVPNKCVNCQGEMVFEFQLLPTIIPKLKFAADAKHVDRLEFATILVYTCRKSCFNTDTFLYKENVILLPEND